MAGTVVTCATTDSDMVAVTPGINGVPEKEAEEEREEIVGVLLETIVLMLTSLDGIPDAETEGEVDVLIVPDTGQPVAGTVTVTVEADRMTTVTTPSAPVALRIGVELLPLELKVEEGAAVMTGSDPDGAVTEALGATVKRVKDVSVVLLTAGVDGNGDVASDLVVKPMTMTSGLTVEAGTSAIVEETGGSTVVSGCSRAKRPVELTDSEGADTVIVVVIVVTVTAGVSETVEDEGVTLMVMVIVSPVEKAEALALVADEVTAVDVPTTEVREIDDDAEVEQSPVMVVLAVVSVPSGPPVTPAALNFDFAPSGVSQPIPVPFLLKRGSAKQRRLRSVEQGNNCHVSDTHWANTESMQAIWPAERYSMSYNIE